MKKPKQPFRKWEKFIFYLQLSLRATLEWFKKVAFTLTRLSIIKHILVLYLIITIIGATILKTNLAQQNNSVSFLDCLFTAASAFSDTGLTVLSTASTWTFFGQAIIAILMLTGGIGLFALKVYFFNLIFNRPMTMFSRQIINAERGTTKIGSTPSLIRVSVTVMLVMVVIGTFALMFYFYFKPGDFNYQGAGANTFGKSWSETTNDSVYSPYHNWSDSIRFGIFHSISAINNAGFDIMGHHSIAPYYGNYYVQIVFIMLFIVGGIGYPVIYDLWGYIVAKKNNTNFRFSLFTKISTLTYFLGAVISLSLVFTFELTISNGYLSGQKVTSFWNNAQNGTTAQKAFAIFFNTMSTRNAGFATVDVFNFSNQTLLIQAIMMFIGSAPSSTAGGIRTTTLAIALMGMWKFIRNKSSVRVFNRRINDNIVNRSYAVIAISTIIILLGLTVLYTSFSNMGGSIDGTKFTFVDVFYEVCSAFGTTGLSTGITPYMNNISKIIFVLIMFIGQLGISSTLLIWNNAKQKSRHFQFVSEDVLIG